MAESNDENSPSLRKIEAGYDADNLGILKGLEAVRHRPGMYVGDTGTNGLHHLFKEIIDNAVDEVLADHCTEIKVVYGADYSLSVEDNGRGIPVEVIEGTGKTGVELVLTELRAGNKFTRDPRDPKASGGLHGVGASCVNALSTWLECEVRCDGNIYRLRCERGVPTGPLMVVGSCPKDEHGTKMTWLADDTMFGFALDAEGHLQYSPERLRSQIRQLAFLNKEVSISFQDAHNGEEAETYHYKNGIAEYVAHLNGERALHSTVIYGSGQHEDIHVEVAMQYTTGSQEVVSCYVNNIYVWEGGTPVIGLKTAVTRTVNQYARKNGFFKEKENNFSGNHIRSGLTAIIALRMQNPQFNFSDKSRLSNLELKGILDYVVTKGLTAFFSENPEVAHVVMNKIQETTQANAACANP